jgi:hypothetical protein
MTAQEIVIKSLQKELRREQIKNLKLRMRMAVLVQHPHGTAAEKISELARADFSDTIIHFN